MQDNNKGKRGIRGKGGIWELSVLSAQFFFFLSKPKTALKNKRSILKRKKKADWEYFMSS